MKILFIIYTCVKRINQAENVYTLLNGKIDAKIIILCGNPKKHINSLFENSAISINFKYDKYMEIDIYDGYEGLNVKTIQLFKSIQTFFPDYNCIKCDDDIIPNIDHIKKIIDYIKTNKPKYAGKPWNHKAGYSIFHYKKNINNNFKIPIKVPVECHYCPGPMYYVDIDAIKIINNSLEENFFEDIMIGLTLNRYNIYPDKNIVFYTDSIDEYEKMSFHNNNNLITFTESQIENTNTQKCKQIESDENPTNLTKTI